MGRKRAAFAEGIAEEEQQYAQVLRDIRDVRGETQQALARLLGWSVSTVSRFEAAAERPERPRTGATARWRQPRSCASGQ
jgi:DNA-binding transcriptional regulator YiaG